MLERLPEVWKRMTPRAHHVAIAAAGALALYSLLGFFVVPMIVRSQVENRAALQLNRMATVARVRFNPFTLALLLAGFELRDRDGTPLASFDTLVVNLSVGSIPRRALVLDEF